MLDEMDYIADMLDKEVLKRRIDVMTACYDGKTIQCCPLNILGQWQDVLAPTWDWTSYDYRVRPETVYRPYNNFEEFCRGYLEHNQGNNVLEHKYDSNKSLVVDSLTIKYFDPTKGYTVINQVSMQELFDNYTWADCTIMGIPMKE